MICFGFQIGNLVHVRITVKTNANNETVSLDPQLLICWKVQADVKTVLFLFPYSGPDKEDYANR